MLLTRAAVVAHALDRALPDSIILQELADELRQAPHDTMGCALIRVGKDNLAVPVNAEMSIVDKALYKETPPSILPTGCCVQVAIGRVERKSFRMNVEYCFAVMVFDVECRRIKLDFRAHMLGYYSELE